MNRMKPGEINIFNIKNVVYPTGISIRNLKQFCGHHAEMTKSGSSPLDIPHPQPLSRLERGVYCLINNKISF